MRQLAEFLYAYTESWDVRVHASTLLAIALCDNIPDHAEQGDERNQSATGMQPRSATGTHLDGKRQADQKEMGRTHDFDERLAAWERDRSRRRRRRCERPTKLAHVSLFIRRGIYANLANEVVAEAQAATRQIPMWGGGKRGMSASSSSSAQPLGSGAPSVHVGDEEEGSTGGAAGHVAASAIGTLRVPRPIVQVWLPDGFLAMATEFVFQESSADYRMTLNSCLDALEAQTSAGAPLHARDEMRLKGEELEPLRLRQYELSFRDGVEPFRLRDILGVLCAAATLVDDTVWQENSAVLASLPPYCGGCDNFGHVVADCQHFRGRDRTEQGHTPHIEHAYGHYAVERLGRNQHSERVICVNGKHWAVKTATGVDFNCLIDSMREMLKPDGIPLYDGYLQRVRRDLATEFDASRGHYEVREVSHPCGVNFLEFLEHTRAVVRCLVRHAPGRDQLGIDRDAACWRPENMKFVCVDLDTGGFSVLPGNAPDAREILIARENGNHFLPLQVSRTRPADLLPWNIGEALQMRENEAARRKAAAEERARVEAERVRAAIAAEEKRKAEQEAEERRREEKKRLEEVDNQAPLSENISDHEEEEDAEDESATGKKEERQNAADKSATASRSVKNAAQPPLFENISDQEEQDDEKDTSATGTKPRSATGTDLNGQPPLFDTISDHEEEVDASKEMSTEAWRKLMASLQGDDDGREPNEDSDADSQAGALSDSSMESDVEDASYVRAVPAEYRTWRTDEDDELERIGRLASHLRDQPHLPVDPAAPTDGESTFRDRKLLDAYVQLPYAHCMVKGCTWTQLQPCKWRRPAEFYLLGHLKSAHKDLFRTCCGEQCVRQQGRMDEGQYLDYLEQAVMHKAENSDMPEVGGALDRRTLAYLHTASGDRDVHAYYCFICSERHVHLRSSGIDHREWTRFKGTIEYFTLKKIMSAMLGGRRMDQLLMKAKWKANFDFQLFVERYMQPWMQRAGSEAGAAQPEHGFAHDSTEWKRFICFDAAGKVRRAAICCPEDVDSSSAECRKLHGGDPTVVCWNCRIPVCLECYSRLWRSKPEQYQIPAAIANDNFQGYIHPFIVQHRVRWIEAVVACPYLTTIVQYYVEGHPRQRHHLANERVGEHERAYAFRGNVFAYHLPWEMIQASACTATSADFLQHWPHTPSMVSHLIKVLFVNTTEEHTLGHLKELHIRAFVLVGLARIYIENGHEDMIRLGCTDACEDVAQRKKRALDEYIARVKHLYPPDVFGDPTDSRANGGILNEIAEMSRLAMTKQKLGTAATDTPFEQKNATGADTSPTEDLRNIFDKERPKSIVEDHRGEEMLGQNVLVKAGFGNLTNWAVRLQGGLLNETFHPKFMSRVLPSVFNYPAGGFEFEPFFVRNDPSNHLNERWRRVPGSAWMDPPTFCRHLARRPEMQFSAEPSCMAIARNVSSMWASVKSAYGSVGRAVQRSAVSSGESATKYLKAAETLLDRHENGKVRIHGKLQNIRGDFTRLRNADGITAEEEDLLALYWKSTRQLSGSQAMRQTFMPKLTGFRTVYGDVLFFTLTPDRKHSALVWRLMRGRRNDTFLQDYPGVEQNAARQWRRRYAGPNEPGLYHASEAPEGMDVEISILFQKVKK